MNLLARGARRRAERLAFEGKDLLRLVRRAACRGCAAIAWR